MYAVMLPPGRTTQQLLDCFQDLHTHCSRNYHLEIIPQLRRLCHDPARACKIWILRMIMRRERHKQLVEIYTCELVNSQVNECILHNYQKNMTESTCLTQTRFYRFLHINAGALWCFNSVAYIIQ